MFVWIYCLSLSSFVLSFGHQIWCIQCDKYSQMYRCSINFHPFSLSNDITVKRYCLPKVGCESRWEHAKDDCEALNESMRWYVRVTFGNGFFSRASYSELGFIQVGMMFHSWKLSPNFLWFVTLLHQRCWADPIACVCVCVFLWFGDSWRYDLLRPVSVTRYVWFCAFLLEKSVLSQNMFSIFDLKYDLLLHVYNDYIMMINSYIYTQYMCVIYFDVGLPHFGSFQITRKTISINQRGSPSCIVECSRDMISVWVIEAAQGIYNSLKKWQHENSNVFWCILFFFANFCWFMSLSAFWLPPQKRWSTT